jgi:hypothetical protein
MSPEAGDESALVIERSPFVATTWVTVEELFVVFSSGVHVQTAPVFEITPVAEEAMSTVSEIGAAEVSGASASL